MKFYLLLATLGLCVNVSVSTIFEKFFQRIGNGIFKDHVEHSDNPAKKLATTPLFYVCTSRGQAYLQDDVQSRDPNQKTTVHFMSSEDALAYLEGMAQLHNQGANEFRIMGVSMEKVIDQIKKKKQSRKLGRFPMNVAYRIQASSRQIDNAFKLNGKIGDHSIPLFTSDNLAIKRANGKVVLPYYFSYEDLKEDYNTLIEKCHNEGIKAPTLKASVRDLTEVMCLSKGINSDSYPELKDSKKVKSEVVSEESTTIGIVPPRREIGMLKAYFSGQIGLPNEYERTELR